MKFIAAYARFTGAAGLFCLIIAGLTGCSALQVPARPVVYDFGPGAVVAPTPAPVAGLRTLALGDVEASHAMDTTAVLYRLAYSDDQELRPYAQARWSMPPAQLLRLRLRERLAQRRVVLNATQGAMASTPALVLRLELDEFSQRFEAADRSNGLVRLLATLSVAGAGGEKLLDQRSFVAQRAATSADAAGGVRALTLASDAVIEAIDQWLQQAEAPAR